MKIFKTRSSEIVTECQSYFGFYTISTLIRKRKATFLYKLANLQNELCELFEFIVKEERKLHLVSVASDVYMCACILILFVMFVCVYLFFFFLFLFATVKVNKVVQCRLYLNVTS